MAIYQFYLAVFPRYGLIKKYGKVPDKIKVVREDEYHEPNRQEYWELTEIDPSEKIEEIDKLLSRANWGNGSFSYNWKTYSEELDNDAWMLVNERTGKIQELSFRADLREKDLKFLKDLLGLAMKYDWLLMDIDGNLVSPEWQEVSKLVKESKSYRFLQDPIRYLNDVEEGRINI